MRREERKGGLGGKERAVREREGSKEGLEEGKPMKEGTMTGRRKEEKEEMKRR